MAMLRRRLFDGEVGIDLENAYLMDRIARNLEIEIDPGESAGDFVAYAIQKTLNEIYADSLESRAKKLRGEMG